MGKDKTPKVEKKIKETPDESKEVFPTGGASLSLPPVEKHAGGRPPKFSGPEDLQARIDEYFESCWVDKITETENKETGEIITSNVKYQNRPYTIMGLALHIGLSRQGLCEYAAKGEFSDIVKTAKEKVEMFAEELLFTSKNPGGAIFWLKNHAGYRDKQEVEHSGSIEMADRIVRARNRGGIKP